MSYVLSKDTELHVSETENGEYHLVGGGLTIATRDENADDEEIYTFGSLNALVSESEDTADIDFTFLFDPADTNGQNILRAAKKDGSSVFIRTLWDGEAGEQRECRVRSINMDADRNGTGQNKFVRGTLSLRAIGPATTVEASS